MQNSMNYSTTNAQQGIAELNIQSDVKLPQSEEDKRIAYRKCETLLESETHVQFLKEGFKYQGGEPSSKNFSMIQNVF